MSNSSRYSEPSSSRAKPFSIALSAGGSKQTSSPLSTSQRVSQAGSRARSPHSHVFNSNQKSGTTFGDESEGEDERPPTHEEVTGFDHAVGGAISARKQDTEKPPLVIQIDSSNDWRSKIKKARTNLLPAEVRAQREAQITGIDSGGNVEVEGPSVQYGLSYAQPSTGRSELEEDSEPTTDRREDSDMVDMDTAQPPNAPATQDEQALEALVRESKGEGDAGWSNSNLVIENQRQTNGVGYSQEDEARSFRADVSSRPDPASLESYASIPVEEFGAAMLRGMGWKEGEPVGKGKYGGTTSNEAALKARDPGRRAGYLGIGAKDLSGKSGSAEAEIGAWGKSAMRKAKKPGEGLYTPVLMRSKKTGEQITEDEFKVLKKEGQKDPDEWEERRDRNLRKHGRHKGRDDYDDEDDSNYRRTGSSSRNGSLSPDRDRRRRDRESERRNNDRRYRERDRESRRGRDRDRDRDRERGREKGNRSSRRSPDESSSSHRSSRRHDSRSDDFEYKDSDRDRDRRDRYRSGSGRDRR